MTPLGTFCPLLCWGTGRFFCQVTSSPLSLFALSPWGRICSWTWALLLIFSWLGWKPASTSHLLSLPLSSELWSWSYRYTWDVWLVNMSASVWILVLMIARQTRRHLCSPSEMFPLSEDFCRAACSPWCFCDSSSCECSEVLFGVLRGLVSLWSLVSRMCQRHKVDVWSMNEVMQNRQGHIKTRMEWTSGRGGCC